MLTNHQVEAFHRDGYVNGGPVLDRARVQELRDELDRVIAEAGAEGKARGYEAEKPPFITNLAGDPTAPVWQIVDIWAASPAFERLVHEPAVVEMVRQLTGGETVRLWHDQIQYKPAGEGGRNGWHQDAPLWPPLSPCGTADDGSPAQLSAWVALDDADEANGCMTMVRGSHTWGDRIAEVMNRPTLDLASPDGSPLEFSLRPVPAGHVHFHHALTWHASHGNQSDRPRRAIALHYMTERTVHRRGAKHHPMERFIESPEGAPVAGAFFPVVYAAG